MVKHIFTSEFLSVQVHPNDAFARRMGLAQGKDEAWFILDCEPGAVIGLGLTSSVAKSALKMAAANGRIMDMIAWKPVAAGDFIYVPAGTIHAIGGGISLVEVQTNVDLTFRLYDYGRPRPLHVDEALQVSRLAPYAGEIVATGEGANAVLTPAHSQAFRLKLSHLAPGEKRTLTSEQIIWFVPFHGEGIINGLEWTAGECWMASGDIEIEAFCAAKALTASPSYSSIG
jgi:mannose-6-phosphate isomerase